MENNSPNPEKTVIQIKEDFFKLLPLIPVWLTILGAAKLHYFYKPYRIDIFSYLDFQEILLLFTNEIYTVLFSFAAVTFMQLVSFLDEPIPYFKYYGSPKWWEKLPSALQDLLIVTYKVLTGPVFLISCFAILLETYDTKKYAVWFVIAATLLVFNLRDRLFNFLLTRIDKSLARAYTLYVTFFLTLLVWTFSSAITNPIKKINDGGYIKINEEVIDINNTNQLLGRTKNYTFIFTPSDSCTRVINNSAVKDFFIKAK